MALIKDAWEALQDETVSRHHSTWTRDHVRVSCGIWIRKKAKDGMTYPNGGLVVMLEII